jgi:hypothetical protein
VRFGIRTVSRAAEAEPAAIVAFSGAPSVERLNGSLVRIRGVLSGWHGRRSFALRTAKRWPRTAVPHWQGKPGNPVHPGFQENARL